MSGRAHLCQQSVNHELIRSVFFCNLSLSASFRILFLQLKKHLIKNSLYNKIQSLRFDCFMVILLTINQKAFSFYMAKEQTKRRT